jgi:hypothetical protein
MTYKGTAILGPATAVAAQMEGAVRRVNAAAPSLAERYLSTGARLGIRGDLAYAQAIFETDYFRFTGVVRPEQNNYCGLGATGPDNPGHSFATPAEGVMAHIQHLFAYASTDPLPPDMEVVDPRFNLVQRGVAPFIGDLNGRWAVPGTTYGQTIDRRLGEVLMEERPGEPYRITRAYLSPTSQNRPGPCSDSYCWEGTQGIVTHRTASPSQNARAIRQYFDTAPDGRFASSHFVVDDQEILLLMPIGEVAYHTAGKNATMLGIETCEHNWGTPAFSETYRKLVWLTGYLVRMFGLTIADVTGHFWWDPVNRPYDPTYMGWSLAQGKARGIFDWNTFIADVQTQITPAPTPAPNPQEVAIRVRRVVEEACTTGILVDSTTYAPLRAFTGCVTPGATVHWDPNGPTVIVDLPPAGGATAMETAVPEAAASNPATASDPAGTQTQTQTQAQAKAQAQAQARAARSKRRSILYHRTHRPWG